jgi:hypothetical protein
MLLIHLAFGQGTDSSVLPLVVSFVKLIHKVSFNLTNETHVLIPAMLSLFIIIISIMMFKSHQKHLQNKCVSFLLMYAQM